LSGHLQSTRITARELSFDEVVQLAFGSCPNNGTDGFTKRCCMAQTSTEITMGFGRGALLWLIGIPIPIIILIALFMHH
jgi:hypothetical protein